MNAASYTPGDRVEISHKYRRAKNRLIEGRWVRTGPGELGYGAVVSPAGWDGADLEKRVPVLWDNASGVPPYARGRVTIVPADRLRKCTES